MMGEMSKDPKLLPKIPGDEITGEVAEVGSQVQGFEVQGFEASSLIPWSPRTILRTLGHR
jgi:D-arabinose 1-dehydrogenase-like Zn-dependent alcohol dehydrogenase